MKAFKAGNMGFITLNSISRVEISERGIVIHVSGFGQTSVNIHEQDVETNKKTIIGILLHFEMIQKDDFFYSLYDDEDIIPKKLKEFLGIIERPVVGPDN